MKITLTQEKIDKVKMGCQNLKEKNFPNSKIGSGHWTDCCLLSGSFVGAVLWGPLFYRNLDTLKSLSLKENKGDFDALTVLTDEAEQELDWWISEIDHQFFPIIHSTPDVEIECDASTLGYGSVCNSVKAGGRWSKEEKITILTFWN
jgi:hypothetical protein